MTTERIKLSAVESVEVERTEKTVKLTLIVGAAPVLSKHLPPDVARRLGDALGFASNDIQFGGAK